MTIRFDQLPADKPGFSIEKGQYKAFIEKAEMRQSKTDATKPPYLNLTLALTNEAGQSKGKIYDIISESDNDFVRYKIKRFLEALNIPLTGSIELKDVCKIANGKSLFVDIMMDEKQTPPRAVVDIFTNEIFYPLGQENVSAPINAPDAADADDPDDNPFTAETPSTEY